jgi:hypothetical protein
VQVSGAFAYKGVGSVLQKLAEASEQGGTRLYYDVIVNGSGDLEFATYLGQRGTDRRISNGGILFGPDLGNMVDIELDEDYTNEATVVYAGGQGEGDSRLLLAVGSDPRSSRSVLGRIEQWHDSRNNAETPEIVVEALGKLAESRPRRSLKGRILDIDSAAYGAAWEWGDLLTASFLGQQIEARVQSISVTFENKLETIESWLEGEVL